MVGKLGEKILKSPDFYVAFVSPIDLTVINKANSKRIGMIQYVPQVGKVIKLSGKRWLVDSFDEATSKIYVSYIKSGGKAMFAGEGIDIDRIIVEKMREIYLTDTIYSYLDERTRAKEHLNQSRLFFHNNHLANTSFLQYGNEDYFLTWAGTKTNRTLALLAQYCLNKRCYYSSFYVSNLTAEDVEQLQQAHKPNVVELASLLSRQRKTFQKYDYLLSDKLLNIEYANTYLDIDSAKEFIA